MFWLVKFLEDVGYDGPRHFDAHAYRTEDVEGVKDFARGCMRTYLILKEKAKRWQADSEIQSLLSELNPNPTGHVGRYMNENANALQEKSFDRAALAHKRLTYERLDQLTMEVLFGIR
jgi:xylose isomerase